jgi:hypothetical protein
MSTETTHLEKAVMIANGLKATEMSNEWRKEFLLEGMREVAKEMISDLDNITLDDVAEVAHNALMEGLESALDTCNKGLKEKLHAAVDTSVEYTLDKAKEYYSDRLNGFINTGVNGGFIDAEFAEQYFEMKDAEPDIKKSVLELVIDND